MVQQPFVGPNLNGQPQQQQVAVGGTSLALPALTANTSLHQPATVTASQYSPQASFYQQQLIKSAQQQYMHQSNQASVPRPTNGLSNGQLQQQQDSPSSNGQPALENLYNNGRPPPVVYAHKPSAAQAFYSQQQAAAAAANSVSQQPIYQPRQQQVYVQQQPQPQQQQQQQVSPAGLSVRQLPLNGIIMPNQAGLSPISSSVEQQTQQRQQQQQMQHLIMSYQQQQQLNSIQQQHQAQSDLLAHQTSLACLPASVMIQPSQQQRQEQLVQQHVDVRWSQIEEQQRQLQRQQQLMSQAINERVHLPNYHQRTHGLPFSDRDSISTLSRFNQFDERRSMTMRSQYTSANHALKNGRQFGFARLTGEALKRIFGFEGSSSKALLAGQNKQRNLNLSVTGFNGNSINVTSSTGNKNIQPFANSAPNLNNNQAKITAIDSGDDYYFKKRVFKYQLVILRFISLLSATFVLLSPVVMLLIPKMESIFHPNGHYSSTSSSDYSDSHNLAEVSGGGIGHGSQGSSLVPSITHAVGLTGPNKQQPYLIAQPQWRIRECTSECDGPLIGFCVRFIILCIAYWAIFFRTQTATLPRIDFQRCLIISIAILVTLAYWLFYIFRVFDKRFNDFDLEYLTIVRFVISMLESLILLHYLAVILLELRHKKKIYCLKVVRSPDGASQYYSCGSLSIQKCAQFVLEKYHREFKNYGPYTEQLLQFEDQVAHNTAGSNRGEVGASRSRPNSPANSHRGDPLGGRPSRRSASRSASRHHSRNEANDHHRSPSRSPVRSRSRSQRKSTEVEWNNSKSNQVKLYQVDLNPPEQNVSNSAENNTEDHVQADKNINLNQSVENKHQENDGNSADQSSDATSRIKESSLETIRAANSTSDLLSQPKTSASLKPLTGSSRNRGNTDDHRNQQQTRDETESVRSVRSRRSTTRSHHRHRDHHRERSASRANERVDTQDDHHKHSHSISMPLFISGNSDPIEEHERKLRRRKYRLLVAVQDTFDQIKLADEAIATQLPSEHQQPQQTVKQALSASQAARSLYPSIARSLQKYLRLTKQTGRHNLQSIYEHLSKCLLFRLSARTFLEKFVNQDPVWQTNETNLFANCRLAESQPLMSSQSNYNRNQDLEINSWSLICDTLLSRQVDSGTFFVLKQGQVSLLVTVARLPHLNLTEEVIDQKSCKFTLGANSESSV